MDANTIVSLVGSLGFPIVCCGALFWLQNKTMKEMSDRIESAISELSHAIAENTRATTCLITSVDVLNKLGGDKHG